MTDDDSRTVADDCTCSSLDYATAIDCPIHGRQHDDSRTVADARYRASPQEDVWLERLDDLPIDVAMRRLEMGERAEVAERRLLIGYSGDGAIDRAVGWNACLDHIRGGDDA